MLMLMCICTILYRKKVDHKWTMRLLLDLYKTSSVLRTWCLDASETVRSLLSI